LQDIPGSLFLSPRLSAVQDSILSITRLRILHQ
jgi:hypothetical protein